MIEHFPDYKERAIILENIFVDGQDLEKLITTVEYWIKQSFDIGYDAKRGSVWSQGYEEEEKEKDEDKDEDEDDKEEGDKKEEFDEKFLLNYIMFHI